MPIIHELICGVTQTGKTTLAREKARRAAKIKNNIVIVYDPVLTETAGGDWPDDAKVFNSSDLFLEYMHAIREKRISFYGDTSYCVFVDESDLIFSHSQKENDWMLTKGRHLNMQFFLMTQRPKMIAPNVRGQCGIVYVFRLSRTDLKMIGDDTAHNDIEKISLDTGDYLVLKSGSAALERHNIFRQLKGKRHA